MLFQPAVIRSIVFSLAVLVCTPSAWADFEKGAAAHEKQDYAVALAEFQVSAEQGDARSQYALGVMYENGQGVAEDAKSAAAWYRKAAEQGHSGAQSNLSWMYLSGSGVAPDDVQAAAWARKAAEQGDARGQNLLGAFLEQGRGVTSVVSQK